MSRLRRSYRGILTRSTTGPDAVADLLKRLTGSLATTKHKAKFALATDGQTIHAENLISDDPPLICTFAQLGDHFGYFLELAGISTVRQIRENAFDIKATGRLNRLYVELLRNNPDVEFRDTPDRSRVRVKIVGNMIELKNPMPSAA